MRMGRLRILLTSLALGLAVLRPGWAQDHSATVKPGQTNQAPAAVSTWLHPEPQARLGSKIRVTGLAVDMLHPAMTFRMFNPVFTNPPPLVVGPVLPPPMVIPAALSGAPRHEPNFAFLRFSFP
jgi:hypothetical protein